MHTVVSAGILLQAVWITVLGVVWLVFIGFSNTRPEYFRTHVPLWPGAVLLVLGATAACAVMNGVIQ